MFCVWTLGIVAYFVPGPTWSPVSRFNLTRSLVERGSLSIDAVVDSTGDRSFAHDHWYTDKAPVPSLLAIPPYLAARLIGTLHGTMPGYHAVARGDVPAVRVYVNSDFRRSLYLCSLFTVGVMAVLMTLGLFEALRRRYSPNAAFFGSCAILLGTPVFPYATAMYGHVVAAAFLVGGWIAAGGLAAGEESADAAPSSRNIAFAGFAWAAAVGCEYLIAVPAAALGVWLLVRTRRGARIRVASLLAGGAAVPVVVVSLYHTLCFGLPWRTGYSFLVRPEFTAGHARGMMGIRWPTMEALYGLFAGDSRGLFYISPLSLAACALVVVAAYRRELGARMAVFLFCVLGALNAGYYMWWGGAAAGPRHLVPVIPFLAVGLAWGWHHLPRLRVPLIVLAGISSANVLAITFVGLEAPEFADVLGQYAWPHVFSPDRPGSYHNSNLGVLVGLSRGVSVAPLLLWIGLGLRVLVSQLPGLSGPLGGKPESAVEPAP